MDASTFKMIEFLMLFAACFAFGFWQLYSVNKEIAERKALEARDTEQDGPAE